MNQLTFKELLLNPSVEAEDEKRLLTQAQRILQLFRARQRVGLAVSTLDMKEIGLQYNARLSEVRRFLVKAERMCIDRVYSRPGGVHYYRMLPCERSSFYREHKEKLEAKNA